MGAISGLVFKRTRRGNHGPTGSSQLRLHVGLYDVRHSCDHD